MTAQLLLTCEHAGNRVPVAYAELFRGADDVLASHRGWDPGALQLANTFAGLLRAPLFVTRTTRLLVEPNRSLHHPRVFSEFTSPLDRAAKQRIIDRYYQPHRNRVESWLVAQLADGFDVMHLSLHTFTTHLNGQARNADIGLLYDPRHGRERQLMDQWHAALSACRPDLRIRRNYPYLGKADGLTTYLRRQLGARYAGLELEVSQLWPAKSPAEWRQLKHDLATTFGSVTG